MEQFTVSHSGALEHAHSFLFPPSTVSIVKEIRLTVTIVAVAWVTVTLIKTFSPSKIEKK